MIFSYCYKIPIFIVKMFSWLSFTSSVTSTCKWNSSLLRRILSVPSHSSPTAHTHRIRTPRLRVGSSSVDCAFQILQNCVNQGRAPRGWMEEIATQLLRQGRGEESSCWRSRRFHHSRRNHRTQSWETGSHRRFCNLSFLQSRSCSLCLRPMIG